MVVANLATRTGSLAFTCTKNTGKKKKKELYQLVNITHQHNPSYGSISNYIPVPSSRPLFYGAHRPTNKLAAPLNFSPSKFVLQADLRYPYRYQKIIQTGQRPSLITIRLAANHNRKRIHCSFIKRNHCIIPTAGKKRKRTRYPPPPCPPEPRRTPPPRKRTSACRTPPSPRR